MQEIVLKTDQRVDVRRLIKDYLRLNEINEYYEKLVKGKITAVSVIVFEKTYTDIRYGNRTPIKITVTNTAICTMRQDSTDVSLVISSDDRNDIRGSLFLYLKDRGFN